MKLGHVLRRECIRTKVRLGDKNEALAAIASLAKQSDVLEAVSEEEILAGLKEREELGTTGFGKGIAIPHCKLKSVTDFVVGVITVQDGVGFGAIDDEAVVLIVFIIAPDIESDKHIKLLSTISQTLLVAGVVKELTASHSPEAVYESFLRHARSETIESEGPTERSLVHVFVQNEDLFHELLQVIAGIDSSSLVVVDTENTRAYLARIPLFAGFWRDEPRGFSRLIMATVDRKLTNETLRRVESITGNLNEQTGVMVTVHKVDYAAGHLNGS